MTTGSYESSGVFSGPRSTLELKTLGILETLDLIELSSGLHLKAGF